MAPTRSKNVSAINVTGPIADLLRPFPVIGAVAGALQGLASSWLSKTTNGLLNNSGFEIGTGTSDRILSVTAGSCGVSAQEAVTVRDGWAGEKPTDVGVPCSDKPTLPGPAAERLEYVWKAEWTANANVDENIFPKKLAIPQCLFIDTPTNPSTTFLPNAARHALSRASFTVVVTVNANPFTAGVLLVVAIPNVPTNEDFPDPDSTLPISQLTLYPHQFINLKTNNQATLHLPYHGPGPLMNHHSTSMYRICGFVFSKLVKTNAISGGTVRYTVQVAPMDVEFYGLHYPLRPNAELDFAINQGLAVRLAPNTASIVTTSPLDDVVVLAQGSQTEMPTGYLPGMVESFCQPLSVPTRMTTIGGSNGGFDVTSSDVAGTYVYAFPIDLANLAFETTYLGSISKLFTHWTGELTFSLMCAANSMTRGRLLVSFLPGITEVPPTMELAMLGTYQIYDIGLNSTFIFPIPFISSTFWRVTKGYGIGAQNGGRFYDDHVRAGVISVWVYTDFQTPSPNNATTVSFIPFISSGNGFALRLPQDPNVFVPPYDPSLPVRHEAPEPTVHMGSADASEAAAAPTQADVDGTPASYSNLEPGQPVETKSSDVWEGMSGFTSHTSPDMLLSNYFGRMRLMGTYYGSPPAGSGVNLPARRITSQKLIPIYWGSFIDEQPVTLLENLTSLFLYAQADVRVDIIAYPTSGKTVLNDGTASNVEIRLNPTNQGKLRVVNLPPGYAKFKKNYETLGDDFSTIPAEELACFPSVTTVLQGPSNTVSVYIPYQSIYNAIPAAYGGFGYNRNRTTATDNSNPSSLKSVSEGALFGVLPDKEFCTIVLDYSLASYYTFEVFLSFHNLRTFIPRPFTLQARKITMGSKSAAMAYVNGYRPTGTREMTERETPTDFFKKLMEKAAPACRAVKPAASGVSVTNP
ncbi:polyprotein P1 [cadicivirus B1]|uniref:Genome polyprotein n=1 Tax=cadicivirus B1 TaxID=3121209 RepID=A0A291FH48_9PICO|nr:polyprotein P1 [Hedgehog dicipivirus]ATG32104.1 polyprotein P1 [Hedgehog dicipivirus]